MSDPPRAGVIDGGDQSNMGAKNRTFMEEHVFLTTELSTLENGKINKMRGEGKGSLIIPPTKSASSIPVTVPNHPCSHSPAGQTQIKFKFPFLTCKLSRDCTHPKPRD